MGLGKRVGAHTRVCAILSELASRPPLTIEGGQCHFGIDNLHKTRSMLGHHI